MKPSRPDTRRPAVHRSLGFPTGPPWSRPSPFPFPLFPLGGRETPWKGKREEKRRKLGGRRERPLNPDRKDPCTLAYDTSKATEKFFALVRDRDSNADS